VNKNFRTALATAVIGLGPLLVMPIASASVVGTLQLNGGGVTVGVSSLVWNGTATVNSATTLTYGSGTLVPGGDAVTLMNLPPASLPLDHFMSFAGIPSLDFILGSVGPGSANTSCATDPCSVFAGSPLILRTAPSGTEVDLAVGGTATDGTVPVSNWFGEFSETVTALPSQPLGTIITPLMIQQYFQANPNATITTTYSGTFVATLTSIVPEPSSITMFLLGGGLIAIALARRPRRVR
jgi:hypothetical protein